VLSMSVRGEVGVYLPVVGEGVRVLVCIWWDVGVGGRRVLRDGVHMKGPAHRTQASTPRALQCVGRNGWSKCEGVLF